MVWITALVRMQTPDRVRDAALGFCLDQTSDTFCRYHVAELSGSKHIGACPDTTCYRRLAGGHTTIREHRAVIRG
jgi:hypothetical protein